MRVLIIAAGGHAQVIADTLLCMNRVGCASQPIGFLDDNSLLTGQKRLGLPILGTIDQLPFIEHDAILIGIGNNHVRQNLYLKLKEQGETFIAAIHPSAIIASDVSIGLGTVIFANVVVNTGSQIGENVILNTACTVDHHNYIANHVHIAPGVHLAGDVQIGERTLIGIAATIMPQRKIGANSIVGAGALVQKDIADGLTVVGVPAKPKGKITKNINANF